MRIDRIRIQNYRSYEDSGPIDIGDKLVLVGENNAGKSNLLRAVDMFLDISPTSPHQLQDFHLKSTGQDIGIQVWFTDLTEDELDVFEEYISDGVLWVKTIYPFDDEDKTPENKRFVVQKQVPAIEDFRGIGDKNAGELQEIYDEHEEKLEPHQIDDWSGNRYGNEIEPTIRNYLDSGEAEWTNKEVTDPQGIKGMLRENLPEFQYFESDRNIADETKTSTNALLGRLLEDVIGSVPEEKKDVLREALDEVNQQLNEEEKFDEIQTLEQEIREKLDQHVPINELNLEISVPDLESILTNVDVSVDDGVDTDIQNMGSGLHTSFILACLWQLSEQDNDEKDVIFGLEEPENDLHPHAQRQLYDTLDDLADQDYQVFLSTHSAFLVSAEDLFDTVRVAKNDNQSRVHSVDESSFSEDEIETIRAKITPDNNEMFFSRAVLLCEGQSEWQTIPVLNSMLHEAEEEVYAFDRLGISLIEVNGKMGFENFLKVTEMFNIPSIVLIDNDRHKDSRHEELVEIIEEMATEVVELPEDLEGQFFRVISLEQFCDVLSGITEYDRSPSDLQSRMDGQGISREEVLRREFEEVEPSKPQFGRALAEDIDVDEIPSELRQVIEQCRIIR
ncbi:MAG: ATP-dependent endonuclease [Candidatus Nanohaloarchaea archaeon]